VQNRYAADETDFLKYALLRRLCNQLQECRLGICWYLTDPAIVDANNPQNDGGRVTYLLADANWRRQVDEDLFAILADTFVVNGSVNPARRSIATIEGAGVFHETTQYFRDQVPQNQEERAMAR
jgi:hypothetical protein